MRYIPKVVSLSLKELIQIAIAHELHYAAPWLAVGTGPDNLDDVRMAQSRQDVHLLLKVRSRLIGRARTQHLDRDETPFQLTKVNLNIHARVKRFIESKVRGDAPRQIPLLPIDPGTGATRAESPPTTSRPCP